MVSSFQGGIICAETFIIIVKKRVGVNGEKMKLIYLYNRIIKIKNRLLYNILLIFVKLQIIENKILYIHFI